MARQDRPRQWVDSNTPRLKRWVDDLIERGRRVEIDLDKVPQAIEGLPVVCAVAPITDFSTPREKEWIVICRQTPSVSRADGAFVVWRVFARRDSATGGYLANGGHYDLSFTRAVEVMMQRAGFPEHAPR